MGGGGGGKRFSHPLGNRAPLSYPLGDRYVASKEEEIQHESDEVGPPYTRTPIFTHIHTPSFTHIYKHSHSLTHSLTHSHSPSY